MARSFKWVDIIFNSEILMYKALFNKFWHLFGGKHLSIILVSTVGQAATTEESVLAPGRTSSGTIPLKTEWLGKPQPTQFKGTVYVERDSKKPFPPGGCPSFHSSWVRWASCLFTWNPGRFCSGIRHPLLETSVLVLIPLLHQCAVWGRKLCLGHLHLPALGTVHTQLLFSH